MSNKKSVKLLTFFTIPSQKPMIARILGISTIINFFQYYFHEFSLTATISCEIVVQVYKGSSLRGRRDAFRQYGIYPGMHRKKRDFYRSLFCG